MKKPRLSDYFLSYGWLLPIFAIVSVVVWYWPITAVNQLKAYEKISIFAECFEFKDEELQSYLYQNLQNDGVFAVDISSYSPTDSMINNYYQAFGTESDILLLSKSTLDTTFEGGYEEILADWISFDETTKEKAGIKEEATYYLVNNKPYALMVYNATDSGSLQGWRDFGTFSTSAFEEDIYLLLRSTSPNFGEVTENGWKTLRLLLERYGY